MAAIRSSSASRWAKASSSSKAGWTGRSNGDDNAEAYGVFWEVRGACGGTERSDTGSGGGRERGEVVFGNVEGPAPADETDIPKDDACLIDSSMALAKSSSS